MMSKKVKRRFGDRKDGALVPVEVTATVAELPTGRVRAELTPLWERLRAGTLAVPELPGGRP